MCSDLKYSSLHCWRAFLQRTPNNQEGNRGTDQCTVDAATPCLLWLDQVQFSSNKLILESGVEDENKVSQSSF